MNVNPEEDTSTEPVTNVPAKWENRKTRRSGIKTTGPSKTKSFMTSDERRKKNKAERQARKSARRHKR